MIDPTLLALLACPRCPSRPGLVTDLDHLRCPVCGARYPVVNGIPHLLPESAEPETSEPTS